MQSDTVESTHPPETTPTESRQKAPRSEAQLAALNAARAKAMRIRQEKAELTRKEKAIARATQERDRQERAAKIQADFEALEDKAPPPAPPPAPAVEPYRAPVEPPKRKPTRRVIHVQEASSGSEADEADEVEVRLPRAKQPVARQPTEMERRYQQSIYKMFHYE